MAFSVAMPALGESVTEGIITQWLKKEGDTVEVDEPLLEISTDKVDTEVPSPVAGVVTALRAAEDDTVEVGQEIAVIAESADAAAPAAPTSEQTPEQVAPAAPVEQPAAETAPQETTVAEQAPPPASNATGGESGQEQEVTMPALGESVTEGIVTQWLKGVGDSIAVDEPLLEISTDKVDTEVPSPIAGTLVRIVAEEDATVEVGGVLAVVSTGAAATTPPPAPEPAPAAAPAEEPAPSVSSAPVATAPSAPTAPAEGTQVYVTPLVRKLARENNVDLNTLRGTGVGGRIRKQDILDAADRAQREAARPAAPAPAPQPAPAAQAPASAPAPATETPTAKGAPAHAATPSPLRGHTEKMSRLRTVVAERMVESLQNAAQLTTVVEVDVTRIARLRAEKKDAFLERHGVKLSFFPFFVAAAVDALREHPKVNSSVDIGAKTVTYHDAEHVGIAVDTERGLVAPVIRDAGDLNLVGVARKIADIAERTRSNKLAPDDLTGATFTITNTGSRGALIDTPVLTLPQAAILGTGAVVKRPVVVNDADLGEIIAPRSMMYLCLSYDHRIVDGADAARYLTAVKDRLEKGNFEFELGV